MYRYIEQFQSSIPQHPLSLTVRITCGDRTRCPKPAGALEPRAPAEAEEER